MATTTTTVAAPPMMTDGTVPNHCAVTPDSTAPHWFEHEMKSAFTAATRPRSASGVRICTSEMRSTTLTASNTPVKKSIRNDSHAALASPKPIVATAVAGWLAPVLIALSVLLLGRSFYILYVQKRGTRVTEVITWLALLFVVGYWTWRLVA